MKPLIFSLILISSFVGITMSFAQDTASLEDIQKWLQQNKTVNTSQNTTLTAEQQKAVAEFFKSSSNIQKMYPGINEEDEFYLTFKEGQTLENYLKAIQAENARRTALGQKNLLPNPFTSTTQAPANNGSVPLSPLSETPKPPIPTAPQIKTPTNIPLLDQIVDPSKFGGEPLSRLLNQLFYIGLISAVVLAIIMIIRGGIEYMTIDSISGKDSGKKRVQAALGGLVLAFAAILILNTINPGLTNLSILFPRLQGIKSVQFQIMETDNDGGSIALGSDGNVYTLDASGAATDTNAVVKGDFSNVTAADLRPHLGPNYTDADVQAFVDAGKQYGIDPRFLASISKFETANGTSKAFTDGRNNAMGTSNSVGPIGFNSVKESIFKQAENLVKQDGYYSKAKTIQEIGNIYSPAVNPKTGKPYQNDKNGTNWSWAGNVSKNYNKMKGTVRTTTPLP